MQAAPAVFFTGVGTTGSAKPGAWPAAAQLGGFLT